MTTSKLPKCSRKLVGRRSGEVRGGAQDEERHEVDGTVALEEVAQETDVPTGAAGDQQRAKPLTSHPEKRRSDVVFGHLVGFVRTDEDAVEGTADALRCDLEGNGRASVRIEHGERLLLELTVVPKLHSDIAFLELAYGADVRTNDGGDADVAGGVSA